MDVAERKAIEDNWKQLSRSMPTQQIKNKLANTRLIEGYDHSDTDLSVVDLDKNGKILRKILQSNVDNAFTIFIQILQSLDDKSIKRLASEIEDYCMRLRHEIDEEEIRLKKKFSSFMYLGEEPYAVPVLGQVPILPDNIVDRERDSDNLSQLLQKAMTVKRCVVVFGEAGCGKTILAHLTLFKNCFTLANRVFSGGVVWLTLGNIDAGELLIKMHRLLSVLSDDCNPLPPTLDEARDQLRAIIAEHYDGLLLVLDDVLDKKLLKHLNLHCCTLVTSRYVDIVNDIYEMHDLFQVTPFSLQELKYVLCYGMLENVDHNNYITPKMTRVIELYRKLPIGINSLRFLINNPQDINRCLLAMIERIDHSTSHREVLSATLDFIIQSLDETLRSQFRLLVTFANNKQVPITAVSLLWSQDIKAAKKTIEKFVKGGLLIMAVDASSGNRFYRLHSTVCDYLRTKYPHSVGLHRKLMAHYKENCGDSLHKLTDDGYIYHYIFNHLLEARQVKTIKRLLCDAKWLQSKLNITSIIHLLNDYIKSRQILNDQEWQEVCHFYRFLSGNMKILLRTDRPTLGQLSLSKIEWQVFSKKAKDVVNKDDSSAVYVEWINREQILTGDDSIVTACLHAGAVSDCRFSSDGKKVLTSSWDGHIKVWDSVSTVIYASFSGLEKISSCCFSPNGNYIATSSWTGSIQVWEMETEKLKFEYSDHSDRVYWCEFSPDGNYIASCSKDKTIRIWNSLTGEDLMILRGHKDGVLQCHFNSHGDKLVSSSSDSTVKIWNVADATIALNCICHKQNSYSRITSCAFFNDNQCIMCTYRHFVYTWNSVTGEPLYQLKCFDVITASAISSNSKYLAVTLREVNAIQVWSLSNQRVVASYRGHTDYTQAVSFSPNGKIIISASDDKTVKFWPCQFDLKRPILVKSKRKQFKPIPFECCFFDNRPNIFCIKESNSYQLRHFNGSDTKLVSKSEKFNEWIWRCCLSDDGNYIAIGLYNGEVKLMYASNQRTIWSVKPHNGSVLSFSFGDKVNKLLVAYERAAYILNKRNGSIIAKTTKLPSVVRHCYPINEKFDKVLLAYKNGKLQIIQVCDGRVLSEQEAHKAGIAVCEVSFNKSLFVTSADDGIVKLWRLTPLTNTYKWHHGSKVTCCAFSTAANRLAAGCENGTITVWDVRDGSKQLNFKPQSSAILSCRFSPDDLVVVSTTDSVVWWNANNGEVIQVFPLYGKSYAVKFSKDFSQFVTIDTKGYMYIMAPTQPFEKFVLKPVNNYQKSIICTIL